MKNRSVRRRFHLFNPHRSLRSSPITNYRNITIIISIPIYHHHHHYNDHLHNFHHHQNNANRQSWRMCCHFCLSIRVWVASLYSHHQTASPSSSTSQPPPPPSPPSLYYPQANTLSGGIRTIKSSLCGPEVREGRSQETRRVSS